MTNQTFGKSGEEQAAEFLRKQGYKIIEQNFRSVFGEIDIIAHDKDTLVYVEVKTRSSSAFGAPEEAVGYKKLQHLLKAAAFYRSVRNNLPDLERIDVVAIETNTGRVELIKNVTG
ncbi:MAG TPA: YraN family protein [Candidatus Saccharimonadales bacterium]|nr:YraN family protein [Candidatus Saccharimonadales bacterium]